MGRFLSDRSLSGAIRKVMKGEKVRCAVAFWGDGACKSLFRSKLASKEARIICDLTMGGTNPSELENLGAPGNTGLRHYEGLHAKLYMSEMGLVVASANASNRGIGFREDAALTECGTRHKPGTKAFRDAEEWFENLWKTSKPVDEDALESASRAWGPRKRPNSIGNEALAGFMESVLVKIATEPEKHRGIGIVFTSGEADQEDVDEAYEMAVATDDELPKPALLPDVRLQLRDWPKQDLFTGWSGAEANAWPKLFLCAHRGVRGGVTYWCYERFADPVETSPNDWSVFAARSEVLRSKLCLPANVRKAAEPDAELLGRVFAHLDTPSSGVEDLGHKLCESPVHLAVLLGQIGE